MSKIKLSKTPDSDGGSYPRLRRALVGLMSKEDEGDIAKALDELGVPHDASAVLDPEEWQVSTIQAIAERTGNNVAYLMGGSGNACGEYTRKEYADVLASTATNLKDAANALEELAELVMPNLPTGPRELFEIAETGLYERIRAESYATEHIANDLAGSANREEA